MRHVMTAPVLALAVIVGLSLSLAPKVAAATTSLKLSIVPLECFLEVVNDGTGNNTYISPKDCWPDVPPPIIDEGNDNTGGGTGPVVPPINLPLQPSSNITPTVPAPIIKLPAIPAKSDAQTGPQPISPWSDVISSHEQSPRPGTLAKIAKPAIITAVSLGSASLLVGAVRPAWLKLLIDLLLRR